jgi:hypothetical protein
MKPREDETRKAHAELGESCAILCSPTCIAESERDRMFRNLLRYGHRPL